MEILKDLIEELVPIVAISVPILIVYIVFHFGNRSEKQFHDTLQEIIKSGQEIKPELLTGIPGYVGKNKERNDIRTGIITAATGIGIALFGFFGPDNSDVLGIGLLVSSIGSGILGYGVYKKNKEADDTSL